MSLHTCHTTFVRIACRAVQEFQILFSMSYMMGSGNWVGNMPACVNFFYTAPNSHVVLLNMIQPLIQGRMCHTSNPHRNVRADSRQDSAKPIPNSRGAGATRQTRRGRENESCCYESPCFPREYVLNILRQGRVAKTNTKETLILGRGSKTQVPKTNLGKRG